MMRTPSHVEGSSGTDARVLSPVRATVLVARREYTTRVRQRSFLVATAVTLAALVVLLAIRNYTGDEPDTRSVGVVGSTTTIEQQLEAAALSVGARFEVRSFDSREDAMTELRGGDVDLLVGVDDAASGDVAVDVERDLPSDAEQALVVFAQQRAGADVLEASGVQPGAYERAVGEAGIELERLEQPVEHQGERFAIGFIAALLVYFGLIMYGNTVAQGVVEEKANRIVELLLTAIRPWQLMLGKVLGIGAIGLTQLAVIIVGGVGAALAMDVLELPSSVLAGAVAWAVVWFVVGFVSYALVFAALAALVSRQEEVASVTAPATTMLVIPYLLAVTMIRPGEDIPEWVDWVSMAPLFSPIMMPMRAAVGAPQWQLWTALALSLVALGVLVWLAGRMYASSVLHTGARIRMRDALRRG